MRPTASLFKLIVPGWSKRKLGSEASFKAFVKSVVDEPANRTLLTRETIEREWESVCQEVEKTSRRRANELRQSSRDKSANEAWGILRRHEDISRHGKTSERVGNADGFSIRQPLIAADKFWRLRYAKWVEEVSRANPEIQDRLNRDQYDQLLESFLGKHETAGEIYKKRFEQRRKRLREESKSYWESSVRRRGLATSTGLQQKLCRHFTYLSQEHSNTTHRHSCTPSPTPRSYS